MKPLSAATAACLPLSLCLLAAAPALADPPRAPIPRGRRSPAVLDDRCPHGGHLQR